MLEFTLRAIGRNALQQLQCIPLGVGAAAVAAEIHLPQGQTGLDGKVFRVCIEIGLQVLVGGGSQRSDVLRQQLQLLPQAAADHDIVLIQAHRPAFAISDLLAHVVLQQALEFLGRRRTLPGAAKRVEQVLLLAAADEDLIRRAALAGQLIIGHENDRTEQQEMDQRLLKPFRHA